MSIVAEWLDIVDDHNNVIGRALRSEVHRLQLKHRSIHIAIFNQQGQILLQKRALTKDTGPGAWDSAVGGHVESGEDYDTAACRESEEELGLILPTPPTRLFILPAENNQGSEFVCVYHLVHDGPFTPNLDEISECRWFTHQELVAHLQDPTFLITRTFSRLFSHLVALGKFTCS
jgi:isopentenyl-diphosphate delta-isomerase type 1